MTRKQALAELIAKVEAGEPSPHYIWQRSLGTHYSLGYRAAGGSLDAAKALHEAVLPKCGWRVGSVGPCEAVVNRLYGGADEYSAVSPDPARAWILAILRALHSMEPDA